MGSIRQRVTDDMKAALKAGEKDRLGVLRMLKARLQEAEVQRRGKEGRDYELTDEEALAAIGTYAKQRRDSIRSYRDAGREELALKEEAELEILKTYLPEQLDEAAIRALVQAAIAESGAGSLKELGAVMKLLMPQVKGKADGKRVGAIVRELLGG